jgi:hypothetical protein
MFRRARGTKNKETGQKEEYHCAGILQLFFRKQEDWGREDGTRGRFQVAAQLEQFYMGW